MSDLRAQLDAIRAKRGELTPAGVLAEARDESHPLHNRFEWDDTIAAERWRTHQAHELIVSVRVSYSDTKGEPRDVRRYHAVRRPSGSYAYETAEDIAPDEVTTKLVLADAEREWKLLRRRYEHLTEFFTMVRRDVAA